MKRTPIRRKTPLRQVSEKRQGSTAPRIRRSRTKATPVRKAAAGEGCTMQVVGVCNHQPETVILAHLRWIGDCGTGIKPTDLQAVFACSECNRWTDSPTPAEAADRARYEAERNFYALRAMVRTQLRLVAKGIISVKGMQPVEDL